MQVEQWRGRHMLFFVCSERRKEKHMGRTLKRVPLDFDWKLNETWQGYINPYYKPCQHCDGDGYTPARRWLEAIVQLILLAGEEVAKEGGVVTHPYLWALMNAPRTLPTPDMAELSTGLSGRAPDRFIGHDALDRYSAARKIIEAAGLDPETWGICSSCEGGGVDPEVQAAYEAWTPSEPPTGEGYQLWETTSEGSPQSPVFATLDELCAWCAEHATTFGNFHAGAEQWKQMLEVDFVHHQEGRIIFL